MRSTDYRTVQDAPERSKSSKPVGSGVESRGAVRGLRRRQSRGFLAAIAVCGAVTSLVLVGALNLAGALGGEQGVASRRPDAPAPSTVVQSLGDGPSGLVAPGQPCLNAEALPTDPVEMARRVDIPIWVPSTGDLAITRAWQCGGTPVMMIGDIQVSFEAEWSGVDIKDKWARLAEETGNGRVVEINGHLAVIAGDGGTNIYHEVMMVHGDTLVRLLSSLSVPIEEMLSLAGELPIPQEGQRTVA